MPIDLRRFAAFRDLPAATLDAVAKQARELRVPAGRWLVRPGRRLSACFFLAEGRVRLLEPSGARVVRAGSRRAWDAVYPGAAGVETLTAARFLRVAPGLLDALAGDRARLEVPDLESEEAAKDAARPASWQRRFLTSPLMQRLDPVAWQRILRAMTAESLPAGARVIEAGEVGRCCYVLCSGRAAIESPRNGEILAVLEPGSLFGEDALVSGRARNASVVMLSAGRVVSLAAEHFQSWLLDAVVLPLPDPGSRTVISLEPHGPTGARGLSLHDIRCVGQALAPQQGYAIVGGSWAERSLAAFLLAEQGVDARPVAHG